MAPDDGPHRPIEMGRCEGGFGPPPPPSTLETRAPRTGFPWGILIFVRAWGTFFWSRCERAALRSRRADPVDVGAAEAGHEHRAMSSVSASAAGSPGVPGPVPTSPRRSRTLPGVTPSGSTRRATAPDPLDLRGNAPRRSLRIRGSPRNGRCIALGTDGSRTGDWERWRGRESARGGVVVALSWGRFARGVPPCDALGMRLRGSSTQRRESKGVAQGRICPFPRPLGSRTLGCRPDF